MNKSNFFKKILIWDLICFLFLIAIDRVTKFLAMYYCEQKNISLIENTLEITYLENYGGALGILSNQRFFFIFISALFITLIIFFLLALPNDKKFKGRIADLVMVFTDGYLDQYKRDPRTMRNLCWVVIDNPGFNVQYKDINTKRVIIKSEDVR